VFNKDLLTDVTEGKSYMIGHCNAGTTKTNKTGMLGTIKCWYNQDGIANILSIHVLGKLGYHIRYDTVDGRYSVSHKDHEEVKFNKDEMGLPYIEVKGPQDVAFVQSVRGDLKGFTKKEIEKATLARKAQGMIGHPSE
jgi:hypothetical protein